jgi:hypothetical protein
MFEIDIIYRPFFGQSIQNQGKGRIIPGQRIRGGNEQYASSFPFKIVAMIFNTVQTTTCLTLAMRQLGITNEVNSDYR